MESLFDYKFSKIRPLGSMAEEEAQKKFRSMLKELRATGHDDATLEKGTLTYHIPDGIVTFEYSKGQLWEVTCHGGKQSL